MHGPLSLDNTTIEESHRLLDEAIAQHQASILALKSQKNSLAPISHLPPEILLQIFSLVKQLDWKPIPVSLRWIAVTHVCSHWRRVSINSPSLWVDPPLHILQWVEEMLKRSKDTGLEIEANLRPDHVLATIPGLTAALQHSSRIKRLTVDNISDASVWNDLQKAFPESAPQLEYFCMTGYEPWSIINLPPDPESIPIHLSEKVFCEAHQLRHLVLADCTLNWNAHLSLLPSLTHLTLRDLDSKPTAKQFMDTLKRMLYLEFLDITNALPIDDAWNSDQVHLASLHTLSVRSKHTEIQAFFRCVTFPPTAMVKIHCTVDEASTAHAEKSDFAGVILNLSRSYSSHTFRSLIYRPFSYNVMAGVQLKLFTDVVVEEQLRDYSFDVVNACANLELSFQWTVIPPTQNIKTLMTNIFSGGLPLQEAALHIFFLGYTDGLDVETIANTFGMMPQVCSVALGRLTSALFLKAMKLGSYIEEVGVMGQVEKLYFPNLSSIRFQKTKFSVSGQPKDIQDPTCVSVESLRDYLIQRSNSGAKIEKLILQDCRKLGKHDVSSLSAVVGELNWDQHESYSDSEDEYEDEEEDEDEEGGEIDSEDYEDYIQEDDLLGYW